MIKDRYLQLRQDRDEILSLIDFSPCYLFVPEWEGGDIKPIPKTIARMHCDKDTANYVTAYYEHQYNRLVFTVQ